MTSFSKKNSCLRNDTPYPDHEYDVSFLKHEFLFEKLVDIDE